MSFLVSVPDARPIEVNLIAEWRRGDIHEPVMSASSGPKDYLKNQIYFQFEADPEIERIRLLIGAYARSLPFAVFFRRGAWYDAAGVGVSLIPILQR